MGNTIILKEDITKYHLVSASEDRSEYWKKELSYAVRLGNEFKGKTILTFQTSEGPKTVETTVWSTTDNYLHLKGGITIPLKSIIEIHF